MVGIFRPKPDALDVHDPHSLVRHRRDAAMPHQAEGECRVRLSAGREADNLPVFDRADPNFCSETKKMFGNGCQQKLRRSLHFIGEEIATKTKTVISKSVTSLGVVWHLIGFFLNFCG